MSLSNLTASQLSVTQANDVRDPVTQALIGKPFLPSRQGLSNDRSLFGYFEVIGEERTVCKATLLTDAAITTVDRLVDKSASVVDVPNQLTGYFYLVNVIDGVAFGYNATAIANFNRTGHFVGVSPAGSLFVGPGQEKPDLSDCEDTLDQLEFVLSKYKVSQGYTIESNIAAKFSAVVTFPTKHFHFAKTSPYSINSNSLSYSVHDIDVRGEPWTVKTANSKEAISLTIWDRNEHPFTPPPDWESPPVETGKWVFLLRSI